jgi:hypothetical protein
MPLVDVCQRLCFRYTTTNHFTLALLYAPTMSYLSEWFVSRRGFANGVVFAGKFSVLLINIGRLTSGIR